VLQHLPADYEVELLIQRRYALDHVGNVGLVVRAFGGAL
jgi:hypothetical protein